MSVYVGKERGRLPHGIFHPLDLFIPRARPSPRCSLCSLARWQKRGPFSDFLLCCLPFLEPVQLRSI